jgi:hypothetical protein
MRPKQPAMLQEASSISAIPIDSVIMLNTLFKISL